jgi:hypothetical protein
MLHTFAPDTIKLLRERAREARKLVRTPREGWSKSRVDPMAVLAVFEPLRIKEGFILRAYQFRSGGNGNGVVWALPVEAEFPSPAKCPRLEDKFLSPPKPPAALDDYMDAIGGDGTPWSYLCASILARELAELGAMWHGFSWSTHSVLGADLRLEDPMDEDRPVVDLESGWRWKGPMPKEWDPRVRVDAKVVEVTFFTYSGLGGETIHRHTDTYAPGVYRFKADATLIATGSRGYIY